MSEPPIVFGQPWFGREERESLLRTLESGWIGQGPLVERFEVELGRYVGAGHVVAVSSCTAALHLSLLAAGVGPGDEVVTTPFTFVATVNAIEHVGARPVFVDVEPSTLSLDPRRVEDAVTERTRAILPVSFGGRPLPADAFADLAERHGLWVVEDAAHALGAVADGRRVGADRGPRWLTCFSFYPNKNLASAEGGAIALADGDLAGRLRSLRLHGLDVDAWRRFTEDRFRPSVAREPGFKYNWTDLQASIALPQLARLEGFLAVREHLADAYDDRLAAVDDAEPVDRGPRDLRTRHALHLYQVRVPAEARDAVVGRLRAERIGAAVHYLGINHHPLGERHEIGPVPVSDRASAELVSLPLHPHLGEDEVDRVVARLDHALHAEGGR